MPAFILDTNHLSAAINRVSSLRERISQARLLGVRIGTCVPVLCELQSGIQQTARAQINQRQLDHVLRQIRIWPLSIEISRVYGAVFNEVRRRGRVLSQVDMMLAALARQMRLTVLTSDRDFEALPDIRTENWLA